MYLFEELGFPGSPASRRTWKKKSEAFFLAK
jgi:hypothetical protein